MKTESNKMVSKLSSFSTQMFFNQITLNIVGFFLATLLIGFLVGEDDPISKAQLFLVPISVILCLIVFMSAYSIAWNYGQREHNLVKYGHIKLDMKRGLKAGLYSQIPGFAFGAAALIIFYTGSIQPFAWYKILYYSFYWLFLLHDKPYLFVIPLIIAPIASHWGYNNGYRFISLKQKIMYKKPQTESGKKKDKRLR